MIEFVVIQSFKVEYYANENTLKNSEKNVSNNNSKKHTLPQYSFILNAFKILVFYIKNSIFYLKIYC